jgi:bifunctional non-homologous end joining protein LigD
VLDGEAVVLGVDGISDFNALHSRKHDEEVQFYAFNILAEGGEDLRKLPLSMRKTNLERLLARRPEVFSSILSSAASWVLIYSGPHAIWVLWAWCRNVEIGPMKPAAADIGSRSRTGPTPLLIASKRAFALDSRALA